MDEATTSRALHQENGERTTHGDRRGRVDPARPVEGLAGPGSQKDSLSYHVVQREAIMRGQFSWDRIVS